MLLENFYKAMKRNGFSTTSYSTDIIKAMDGTVIAYNVWYMNSPFTSLINNNTTVFSSSGGKLLLGSGTTPPTYTDYTLESLIADASITQTSTIINTGAATSTMCGFAKTVTNVSASPITITEIGYAVSINNATKGALVTRTLLPTPITLQPNDMYTFTEYIKISI